MMDRSPATPLTPDPRLKVAPTYKGTDAAVEDKTQYTPARGTMAPPGTASAALDPISALCNQINALAVSLDHLHRKLDYIHATMPRTPPASGERACPFYP